MADPVTPESSRRQAAVVALLVVTFAVGGCSNEQAPGPGASSVTAEAEQATSSPSPEPPPELTTPVPGALTAPPPPSSWSRETAATLENSFYFEFADLSHGVMRSDACGREIGLQFIDDPHSSPDSSCLAMR